MSDENTKSESKKDGWLIVLFSAIGSVIAALSFLLFYKASNTFATVGICILDVVYSYFNFRLFVKSKDWNGARHVFILLLMIAYWTLLFSVICIGNAILFDGVFSSHFFLYPIFLMPTFELVIALLCLIGAGL